MLFSKNLNVLTLAIATSRADVVSSLLAPADDASSSYLKKKRERRREDLLLRGMEQRMDMMKADSAEDEAGVDPNTGADVGDLSFSVGEVDEEIDDEGRILKPDNENACKKCVGDDACVNYSGQPIDVDKIGCQSCLGDRACYDSGSDYYIGRKSCIGSEACAYTYYGGIGDRSCNAPSACYYVHGDIGDRSCNAPSACYEAEGFVGDKSCNAEGACFRAGFGTSAVTIGSNSCNAYYACAGNNTESAPDTCNKPCECCGTEGRVDCTQLPKCPQYVEP